MSKTLIAPDGNGGLHVNKTLYVLQGVLLPLMLTVILWFTIREINVKDAEIIGIKQTDKTQDEKIIGLDKTVGVNSETVLLLTRNMNIMLRNQNKIGSALGVKDLEQPVFGKN